MHRFWSDLTWNKLTLAHGCYWKKCSFCDTSLDYIGRYEASPEDLTLERMKRLVNENGLTGFHFTDEAAPPKVLRSLSEKILADGLTVNWWGNIRFDRSFDRKLVSLMADAGCVAISGGLEVASDRLLTLMQKGVTVAQVARVAKTFRDHGILVHAYLMYGFPSETVQETVDSLERVRQLFSEGCLDSAFWHRFSATAHSPIGLHPEKFKIKLVEDHPKELTLNSESGIFARNDLEFVDPTGVDHDLLGTGLRKALFNFMHGVGLDEDVRSWFSEAAKHFRIPKPDVSKSLIRKELA